MKAIKDIRLRNYDYTSNGYYFVTICTNYKKPYLQSDNIRNIVVAELARLNELEGVKTDYYIVMPTHIHLIIIMAGCKLKLGEVVRRLKASMSYQINKKSLINQVTTNKTKKSLINQVTTNKTKQNVVARFIGHRRDIILWQPGYYEHVIRNKKALAKIRQYIINNPYAEGIKFEQFYEEEPHK